MIQTMPYTLIQKIKSFGFFRSKTQPIEVTKSWSLYQDLTIPLSRFIKIVHENDLNAVIISGEPTEYALHAAVESIIQAFSIRIGGRELDVNTAYAEEYTILSIREKVGKMVIEIAENGGFEKVYETMKLFDFPLPEKLTESNKEKAFKKFIGYFNKEGLRLDNLQVRLYGNGEEDKESKKLIRSDYSKFLTAVSLAFNIPPISVDAISVEQYCDYHDAYMERLKSLESQRKEFNKNK